MVGPKGLEFEVRPDQYERMKEVFLTKHILSEDRADFDYWLFEQLVKEESRARAA